MEEEKERHRVIVTNPAEVGFYEIVEYLYENYPIEKAEKIADEIRNTAMELHYQPERGTPEPNLLHRKRGYRYILYKRTSRAEIKIIYYIEKKSRTVYITDFFPTEKDSMILSGRNR